MSHFARNGFLTAKGLFEAAKRRSLEGLSPRGDNGYVDSIGSVSADGHGPGHPRNKTFDNAHGLSDRELLQLEMFNGS
jgi:hypothetical protein